MTLPALLNSLGEENHLGQGHLLSASHLSACQAQPLADLSPSAASRLLSWVLAQITRLGAPKSVCTLLHILFPSEPGVTCSCPPSLPSSLPPRCPQLPTVPFPSPRPPHPFLSFLFLSLLPGPLQVLASRTRGSCLKVLLCFPQVDPRGTFQKHACIQPGVHSDPDLLLLLSISRYLCAALLQFPFV